MAELRGCRVVALIALLFFEQTQNQKILSDTKQCGDPQCESLILRAQAIHDYQGPDCRYLSFKTGDEINVYYKLSGKRADLWQGSKGKSYGFFPKDTVSIEEVYLTKEIEVPAQEIDFICLNGGEYVFENEDSVLYKPDETEYSDMDLAMTGDDTFKHQDQNINGNTQIDADLQESQVDLLGKTVPVTSTWAVSDIAGWFGIGKREEIEVVESNKDVKNEDTFRSRKIAISEDMALKESDDVQPENSGWFGGQFTKFLPFGQKQTEAENDNDMLIPSNEGGINDGEKLVDTEKDRSVTIDADPEIKTAEIEKLIHEKEGEVKDAGNSQSKWFNFGITNILGFGNGNEIKEQETAITDSPVISIPSEDVPSNQNTQTETSKVDEIKDNTDSTQHIHPEDVIVKNAPGKGGSDDLEAYIAFTDKIEINALQDKGESDNVVISTSEHNNIPTPWYKSVITKFVNLEEGNIPSVRTFRDQPDVKESIPEIQTPDLEHTYFETILKSSRDLVDSETSKVKDDVVNTVLKDCTEAPFSEFFTNHMAKDREQLQVAEQLTDTILDYGHAHDDMNIKKIEEIVISPENYNSTTINTAGSSQQENELEMFETKEDQESMTRQNIDAVSNIHAFKDLTGSKHEALDDIIDSPQQMRTEKETETKKDSDFQATNDKTMNVGEDLEYGSFKTKEVIQEEENQAGDSADQKTKWFNFGIKNILGFGNRNELQQEQEINQNLEETGKHESTRNLNPSEEDSAFRNTLNEKTDIIIDTGKIDAAHDNVKCSENRHLDGTVHNKVERDGHEPKSINTLKETYISQEKQYSITTNNASSSQEGNELEKKSETKKEKQEPVVQNTNMFLEVNPTFKENSEKYSLKKRVLRETKEKQRFEDGMSVEIDEQSNSQINGGSAKEHDNPEFNDISTHSAESQLRTQDIVEREKYEEQNEDSEINLSACVEIPSDISKLNKQDVSVDTTNNHFEDTCAECQFNAKSDIKEDTWINIRSSEETLELVQEEFSAMSTEKETKDQTTIKETDSAVDESSKFDFEKPATAEHYTVKENLDLSLKHTNYLASSLLSFWEEIQLWEIPLLWETASANMLAIYSSFKSIDLSPMKTMIYKAVSSLPEDLQPGPDFFGYSWDVVIFTTLFGFFTIFAFTCRTIRSIKSRSYAKRESKLGVKFAELLDSKSEVLEKLSVVQKEYDDLQLSLQDSSPHKLLSEITEQKALQETLQDSNISFDENLRKLEQELEDEKKRSAKMDAELAEVYEKIKSLEEDLKKGRSQKEEIHTTKKVFEINKVRLETSFQDTVEEKSLLQESIKQLAKEEEGWEERFSELSENSKILSSSMDVMQEDMANKQVQVKSLIDSLLKMKDWSSDVDEDDETEENSVPNIKWDFENGEPLADPQKRTIKKLIYAAMLNASLRTVESEKRQLSENLTDEMKAKEQLLECIKNLQNTMQSLSSEKGNLGIDVEKLKQKISVMSEMYQENETKLHRKLTVQEKERMQKEQKLSKVDEKITFATEELFTSRTRAKELEEELERTARSYQSQVTSYEKKAHDNWLIARAAERELSDYKKETAHIRQRLTESEYKLDLIQKDPFALDVMHAISRDNSPFGPSPVGRLQEGRAFLSPPTLMEGPLRLSPMLPGADRGMRPPGYYPVYAGVKERGDVNADRKSDHQRTLSDSGSLSPPWEREQKNSMPPPGLSYQEPPFPIRRPERFYHYPPPSGRFSGPAELTRNQGKPFMDAPDGRTSPEYRGTNTNRNGSEENDALPSHLPPKEGETIDGPPLGYGVHPPPAMRIPLLPVDPRGPFFRRPFPPPPPHPMEMYGPRDYPGMAPMPMRHPNPQLYPPFPMHGDPYFPPPHLRPPPPRSDHPTEPAPPPNSETQDQQPEPHT